MMNQSKQPSARNSGLNLLAKIGGLFALSFVLFFMFFLAYDLISGTQRKDTVVVQATEEIKPDVDIPKIAEDLAKVLASNGETYSQDVKDPFNDRAGLSSASGVTTSSSSGARVVARQGTSVTSSSGTVTSKPSMGISNPGALQNGPIEDTKLRYAAWLERSIIVGETNLDPRVFAIEDLTPVGLVDGGSGQQEVMFYSQAAAKTVSFPVGTVFFDGWLTELRSEGVVFSSNDERRTVRIRSWARSLKNLG